MIKKCKAIDWLFSLQEKKKTGLDQEVIAVEKQPDMLIKGTHNIIFSESSSYSSYSRSSSRSSSSSSSRSSESSSSISNSYSNNCEKIKANENKKVPR